MMLHETRATSLTQKVILSSGLRIAQQVVGALSGIAVARLVGPEVLGTLAYAGAFAGMFAALADLGFGTAHIKRVSEGHDLGRCMGTAWLTKVLGLVVMTLVVLVLFWTSSDESFATGEQRTVFYLVLATLIVTQLDLVPVTTLVAFQDVFHKDLPPTLIQAGNAIVRVVVAFAGAGVVALAAADLSAAVLLLVVYCWLLRKLPVAWPTRPILRSYLVFGAPTFLVAFAMGVSENIDRVLLQAYAGMTEVGQYSAGMRLGSVLLFLSTSVAALVFPSMSRAYAAGRPDEAFALCRRAERRLALVLYPLVLGMAAVAGPMTSLLLGEKYANTGPVVALATLSMVLQTLAQPSRQIIVGAEKIVVMVVGHGLLLGAQVAALYIVLAGPGALVPGLGGGAPGTAFAMAASSLAGLVLWQAFATWFLNAPFDRSVWVHTVSALIVFIPIYPFAYASELAYVGPGIAAAVVAVGVHALVLWRAGELGRSELLFLRDVLSLPSLKATLRKPSTVGPPEDRTGSADTR